MADVTKIPDFAIFQWSRANAKDPRLAQPIDADDTEIQFTSPPLDEDGKIIEVRNLEEGEKTDFVLEGSYNVWTQVNKGELDGGNAIMTRQLQFKGNMSSIIRYSKAFMRLFELMQTVPVDY